MYSTVKTINERKDTQLVEFCVFLRLVPAFRTCSLCFFNSFASPLRLHTHFAHFAPISRTSHLFRALCTYFAHFAFVSRSSFCTRHCSFPFPSHSCGLSEDPSHLFAPFLLVVAYTHIPHSKCDCTYQRTVTISQSGYITKILGRFGLTDTHEVSTPIDPNI